LTHRVNHKIHKKWRDHGEAASLSLAMPCPAEPNPTVTRHAEPDHAKLNPK